MTEPPGDVVAEIRLIAEAEVIHGNPERCDDQCRERCAAEHEKGSTT